MTRPAPPRRPLPSEPAAVTAAVAGPLGAAPRSRRASPPAPLRGARSQAALARRRPSRRFPELTPPPASARRAAPTPSQAKPPPAGASVGRRRQGGGADSPGASSAPRTAMAPRRPSEDSGARRLRAAARTRPAHRALQGPRWRRAGRPKTPERGASGRRRGLARRIERSKGRDGAVQGVRRLRSAAPQGGGADSPGASSAPRAAMAPCRASEDSGARRLRAAARTRPAHRALQGPRWRRQGVRRLRSAAPQGGGADSPGASAPRAAMAPCRASEDSGARRLRAAARTRPAHRALQGPRWRRAGRPKTPERAA